MIFETVSIVDVIGPANVLSVPPMAFPIFDKKPQPMSSDLNFGKILIYFKK